MSDELCEFLAVVALGALGLDDERVEESSRIIEIANMYAAAGCEDLLRRLQDPNLRLTPLAKAIEFASEMVRTTEGNQSRT